MPFHPVQQRRAEPAALFGIRYIVTVALTLAALTMMATVGNCRSFANWICAASCLLASAVVGISVGTIIFVGFREIAQGTILRIVSALTSLAVSALAGALIASPVVIAVLHTYDEDWKREGPGLLGNEFVIVTCVLAAGVIGCVFGAGAGLGSRASSAAPSGETT